jgi:hypothetical protein
MSAAKVALSLFLAAASLPACASYRYQDEKAPSEGPSPVWDYSRQGPYASAALVQGFENFDTRASEDDSNVGIALRGGARLKPEVAVEGFIESVPGFEIAGADLDLLSFGAQGKYFLSRERIQPYALAGLGVARAEIDRFDEDESGMFLRVGFGSDFQMNRDVSLFAELNYNRMFGGVDDLDHLDFLVGLTVRF